MTSAWSPRTLGLWIGALMLVSLVFGGFGEMYAPDQFLVAGDPGATASHILQQQTLFRLGYGAYVVEGLCDAALTALLYLLLRPAGRELALIALLMRIVSTAAFAAAESFYFSAAVPALNTGQALSAFSPAQLNALTVLMLKFYIRGGVVPTLFYGVAWILLGRLVFISGYLPKWLGALLALAGLSFVTGMFVLILAPDWSSPFFLLPMILGMLVLALYLIIHGVDEAAWRARAGPGSPP